MSQSISVVDAFTDTPFAGNPAAVCVLPHATTEEWMQAVAAEMNLSETAFLVARDDGDHDLRWFTPTTEVELCGHATLGSAHVLGGEARFHTRSGLLTCHRGAGGRIEMDFPAITTSPTDQPGNWSALLGLLAEGIVGVWDGGGWTLVQVGDAATVRSVLPHIEGIRKHGGGVIVVAAPGDRPGIDSVCRVFAPAYGINEDPVTGSAHCVLAPWLAARTGRREFVGEQASARGGIVGMRVEGDRVVLSGRAVTVMEGTLCSSPPR